MRDRCTITIDGDENTVTIRQDYGDATLLMKTQISTPRSMLIAGLAAPHLKHYMSMPIWELQDLFVQGLRDD